MWQWCYVFSPHNQICCSSNRANWTHWKVGVLQDESRIRITEGRVTMLKELNVCLNLLCFKTMLSAKLGDKWTHLYLLWFGDKIHSRWFGLRRLRNYKKKSLTCLDTNIWYIFNNARASVWFIFSRGVLFFRPLHFSYQAIYQKNVNTTLICL